MQQLEIKYFFPFTEQIDLDLDYKPSQDYIENQRSKMIQDSILTSNGNIGIGGWNITNNIVFQTNSQERMRIDSAGNFHIAPDISKSGYWEVTKDFFIYREKKPNPIIKLMTKVFFGWNWKDK
jgi:hypothetical protein